MAAPTVHVDESNSSDSDDIPDDQCDSDLPDDGTHDVHSDSVSVSDEERSKSGTGLGNVIAKILHKNVPVPGKDNVLSKGLTDRQLQKRKKLQETVEADGSSSAKRNKASAESSDSEDNDSSDDENGRVGYKIDPLRVKPNPLEKDHEKLLQRTATKGVVHLFNAVQKQQRTIEEKMKIAGSSEVKKGHVMRSLMKGGFMDMLKQNKTKTDAINKDNEPSWKILRDDFMMGAKLKDWDKDDNDEGGSDG